MTTRQKHGGKPAFETTFGLALVKPTTYADGKTFAIVLNLAEGEPLTTLSRRLVNEPALPPNCFYCKPFDENKAIASVALRSGWFKEREDLQEGKSGFCSYPVWEFLP